MTQLEAGEIQDILVGSFAITATIVIAVLGAMLIDRWKGRNQEYLK